MKQSNLIKEDNRKGSFLWEVRGGNAKLYLKGTVHVVPKSFFPLKNEIMNSFDKCNNFVLEVILDENEIEGMKVTNDIINDKKFIYEDGDSLYNHFPKEKVIELRDYLVSIKICSEEIAKKFYKLKPEVVKELIFSGIQKKMGIDHECIGIDYYFMKRAKRMGKNILELETAESQEEIITNLFRDSRISDDNNLIVETEVGKTIDDNLSILYDGWFWRFLKLKMFPWFGGNVIKTIGSLYGNEEKIKKMRDRNKQSNPLIGNRDEKMCNKIEQLLKTKDSYFIAVGAMHLIGEGSIIDRLDKMGYEIIRVC